MALSRIFFRFTDFSLGASSASVLCLVALVGCGNSEGITVPAYSPGSSASKALSLFDENKNGTIEEAELLKCPGLQAALPRMDQDGDGKLTSSEISYRISYYKSQAVGLTAVQCVVLRNGHPLPDAKVTLVPEEFMQDSIQPATGTTDGTGRAGMRKEGLEYPGLQVGLYRVQISLRNEAGMETIPAKYNETTTLGTEVAPDVPDQERGILFDLKIP